ncbi:MAG: SDR family oxidoreductase [Firmicutes bacterium]|nr:SDR family oxidoreductase [Bacillota bacterium]
MAFLDEQFGLYHRTALVTGARTGIGQAIAVGLAQAGADVIAVGHGGDMSQTVDLVEKAGRRAEVLSVDLRHVDEIEEAYQRYLRFREIDILINNAGIIKRCEALSFPVEAWQETLSVNVNAAFRLTQLVGHGMVQRRSGKIIQIASLLSFQGGRQVVAYTASKHAVVGLTKALANEWGPFGVQVNAIAPGYIKTNNTQPLYDDPARYQEILGRIPEGRWGSASDVVGAAVFLASPASDYINGHVLVVDGGWLSW